jgi:capsular polysaccharide biosynthesis protein
MANNIKEFKKLFIKWLAFLIITPMIFASLAYAASAYLIKPIYKSSASLLILNINDNEKAANMDYTDIMSAQLLIKSYKEIVKSKMVLEEVKSKLHLTNLSIDYISNMVNVEIKGETQIMTISVKSTDPDLSKKVADEVSNVFISKVSQITNSSGSVTMTDQAETPSVPDSPNLNLNLTLSAFLGLFAAIGVVLVKEHFDNSIKTPEEIESMLNFKVLGIIPKVKTGRSGLNA